LLHAASELDEQVGIAALGVEIGASGGGAENLKPADVKPAAKFGQGFALTADGGVRGWLRERDGQENRSRRPFIPRGQ
jgi:hypothetical protein